MCHRCFVDDSFRVFKRETQERTEAVHTRAYFGLTEVFLEVILLFQDYSEMNSPFWSEIYPFYLQNKKRTTV